VDEVVEDDEAVDVDVLEDVPVVEEVLLDEVEVEVEVELEPMSEIASAASLRAWAASLSMKGTFPRFGRASTLTAGASGEARARLPANAAVRRAVIVIRARGESRRRRRSRERPIFIRLALRRTRFMLDPMRLRLRGLPHSEKQDKS
jgi:hypothetical protein